MKCAIYGAGSLGTVLGAYLTRANVDVVLVNRNVEHIKALKENGARIVGRVYMQMKVKAALPEEMGDGFDCIFLMTKQLDNVNVVRFLEPKLKEDGVIVTLQNGLPEPLIASIIGPSRTLGCIVEWGATMKGPGISELTSDEDGLYFHMGKMPGVSDEKFQMVKQTLEKMCPVDVEDNILGARFTKMLVNSTFSGLGTVIGGSFGAVINTKKGRELSARCMKECVEVSKANNITLAKIQGRDVLRFFYYQNNFKKKIVKILIPIGLKNHKAIIPSMLQDIRKGKKCEVDAINGVICEYGRKSGVLTPINDRIVEIIHKQEEGLIPLSAKNINLFDDILSM